MTLVARSKNVTLVQRGKKLYYITLSSTKISLLILSTFYDSVD